MRFGAESAGTHCTRRRCRRRRCRSTGSCSPRQRSHNLLCRGRRAPGLAGTASDLQHDAGMLMIIGGSRGAETDHKSRSCARIDSGQLHIPSGAQVPCMGHSASLYECERFERVC